MINQLSRVSIYQDSHSLTAFKGLKKPNLSRAFFVLVFLNKSTRAAMSQQLF